jgi:type VI secretion system protein ImpA
MSTPEIFDFEQLLKPISDEHPCGQDVREDKSATSPYHGNDAIKQRRVKAGEIERKHPNKEENQDENFYFRQSLDEWKQIDKQARAILSSQSKDLQITSWLIEALVRLYGFAGLRDGFRLAAQLISRYWDGIYPTPDEDDPDNFFKVQALANLNGVGQEADSPLVRAIWRVPLTEQTDRVNFPPLTYLDYQKQNESLKDSAAKESSSQFFANLRDDLKQCQEELAKLCQILDEKCGSGKFPSSHIRNALAECREAVRNLSNETELAGIDNEENIDIPDKPANTTSQGGLTSRENALQTLLQVANYFERTEPHSPLPSLLKQAVRWARMSYADWLNEVITNESVRSEIFKLTGIRPESK